MPLRPVTIRSHHRLCNGVVEVAGKLVGCVGVEDTIPDLGGSFEPIPLRGRRMRVHSSGKGEQLVAQLLRETLEAGHARPKRPVKNGGEGGLIFEVESGGGGGRLWGVWLLAGQQEEMEVAGGGLGVESDEVLWHSNVPAHLEM